MPAPPRQLGESFETGAALVSRKMVMAKDQPRAARQAHQGVFQCAIVASVTDEPHIRQAFGMV